MQAMIEVLKSADAAAALPELVLAVCAMALLMVGVFRKSEPVDLVNSASLLVLAGVAALVIYTGEGRVEAFHGAFVVDTFARVMKVLALFGSAAAIMLSVQFMKAERIERFEYPILILLATLGMMAMISANDLIAMYMGVELQSLALYVLAAINRDSARSAEAGLKYFVLGALSSGMLLYGCSLIYGFSGSTDFATIATVLKSGDAGAGLIFGLVFLIAGLAFKISAVPFHMWTPDVYEGSPTPVATFFAAAPKVAAVALFVRVMITPFPAITPDWQQILVFISIASMTLGAFAAIGQTNIKRLLAYSSIGHMGYALVGLASGSQEGVRGVVIYMTVYMITTLGAFGCVLAMRRRDGPVEEIEDLAGLARTNKSLAMALGIFMFSLAGVPWMAGFLAKFFVFAAAIKAGLITLAVIGVLASVVSAFYYLRVVKIMYFDEPVDSFEPMTAEVRLIVGMSAVFVFFLAFGINPIVDMANAAAASLF